MDSTPKTELKDVEKKLTELKTRLEGLMQIVWGSKNVDSKDVLPAVDELLSLLEWAAQKPDIWPQGALLFMQLQGLQKIKESLEISTNGSEETSDVDKASSLVDQPKNDLSQEGKCSSNESPFSRDEDRSSKVVLNEEQSSVVLNHEKYFDVSSADGKVEEISQISPDSNILLSENNFDFKVIAGSSVSETEPFPEPVEEEDVLNLVSDGIGNLIRKNEEMKELLASNLVDCSAISCSNAILQSSSAEIQDLLSSDFGDVESNIDIFPETSNNVTTPILETCDLLMDEAEVNLTFDVLQANDFNVSTEVEELVRTSEEDVVKAENSDNPLKIDTEHELVCLMQNNEDVMKCEVGSKELLLNNLDILTQPESDTRKSSASKLQTNIEVEDSLLNDLDRQSNVEAHGLTLSDPSKPLQTDTEIPNLNFTNADRSTLVCEAKDIIPTEKVNLGLIDLLTSCGNMCKSDSEEEEKSKYQNLIPSIKSMKNEIMILETTEADKTTELVNDPKITKDPLDICMFAIRNLYDNLRAKENEILKMSVIKNDQKHIEALQAVIVDFHKEITNLNSRLDKANKENEALKEQVLELEEAENDARSKAQKLEQKLIFLQEKDMHSQGEISHLKKSLKINSEKLLEKEQIEKELRSQIKYIETLVQKYEDQIKVLEAKENIPKAGTPESVPASSGKSTVCGKGTQTYPYHKKLENNVFIPNTLTNDSEFSEPIQESKDIQSTTCGTDSTAVKQVHSSETPNNEDQYVITIQDGASLKELNDMLCKLMHEDVALQQQIHNVDEINLDLWKKLQNLETNIGECKKKDINDTDLSQSGCEPSVVDSASDVMKKEINPSCEERNIPTDSSPDAIESDVTVGDLNTDENVYQEEDKKFNVWKETEKQFLSDLKELVLQKDDLVKKIEELEIEKERLEKLASRQQTELDELKEKNQKEISKLRAEQENMCSHLQKKVNQLISEEKNLLKMIKNMKSERSTKSQTANELEILKCNYIQLQIELSNSREEKRKLEQSYKIRIDECVNKHKSEEARLTTELERLQSENAKCDARIREFQLKQHQLLSELEVKEQELKTARERFDKSLADTEKEHQSVEKELKSELHKLEEGTVRTTSALIEERLRVEERLQENITNLREKEMSYLSRIAELEKSVIQLHEELNKVAEKSEKNKANSVIQESNSNRQNENLTSASPEPPKSNILPGKYSDQWSVFEASSKQSLANSEKAFPPASDRRQHVSPVKQNDNKLVKEEENVEDLRSQVRELQAQLEKISEETKDVPSDSQGSAISAPYMGLQKDELDYAEADECVADWREPVSTAAPTRNTSHQYRPVYEDRYPSRYKSKTRKESSHSNRNSIEENVYDEILPRPTNFHVVQQVGTDALLVGWSYVNVSYLEGFEIYLDNRILERIYIADRTKAILSGLNLRKSFTLSIRALSRYGQLSEPATLELSCQPQTNSDVFEEDEDEYSDIENSYGKHRPYSMEW